MSGTDAALLVVATALLVYLLVALLAPEKF